MLRKKTIISKVSSLIVETTTDVSIKSPIELVPIKTKGEGDCAFHAIFGSFVHGQYFCTAVAEKREQLAAAIRSANPVPGEKFYQNIIEGIKALVMDFEQKIKRGSSQQQCLEDISENYKGAIDELLTRYMQSQSFKWEETKFNIEVFNAYADFIGAPGRFLMQADLKLIAEVFNVQINYYICRESAIFNAGILQQEGLNDNPQVVSICFDGVNHYERMGDASERAKEGERAGNRCASTCGEAEDASHRRVILDDRTAANRQGLAVAGRVAAKDKFASSDSVLYMDDQNVSRYEAASRFSTEDTYELTKILDVECLIMKFSNEVLRKQLWQAIIPKKSYEESKKGHLEAIRRAIKSVARELPKYCESKIDNEYFKELIQILFGSEWEIGVEFTDSLINRSQELEESSIEDKRSTQKRKFNTDLKVLIEIKQVLESLLKTTNIDYDLFVKLGELIETISWDMKNKEAIRNKHGYRNRHESQSNKRNLGASSAKFDFEVLERIKLLAIDPDHKALLEENHKELKQSIRHLLLKVDLILKSEMNKSESDSQEQIKILNLSEDLHVKEEEKKEDLTKDLSKITYLRILVAFFHDISSIKRLIVFFTEMQQEPYISLNLTHKLDRYYFGYFLTQLGEAAKEISDFIRFDKNDDPKKVLGDEFCKRIFNTLGGYRQAIKDKPHIIYSDNISRLLQMKLSLERSAPFLKFFLNELNSKLLVFKQNPSMLPTYSLINDEHALDKSAELFPRRNRPKQASTLSEADRSSSNLNADTLEEIDLLGQGTDNIKRRLEKSDNLLKMMRKSYQKSEEELSKINASLSAFERAMEGEGEGAGNRQASTGEAGDASCRRVIVEDSTVVGQGLADAGRVAAEDTVASSESGLATDGQNVSRDEATPGTSTIRLAVETRKCDESIIKKLVDKVLKNKKQKTVFSLIQYFGTAILSELEKSENCSIQNKDLLISLILAILNGNQTSKLITGKINDIIYQISNYLEIVDSSIEDYNKNKQQESISISKNGYAQFFKMLYKIDMRISEIEDNKTQVIAEMKKKYDTIKEEESKHEKLSLRYTTFNSELQRYYKSMTSLHLKPEGINFKSFSHTDFGEKIILVIKQINFLADVQFQLLQAIKDENHIQCKKLLFVEKMTFGFIGQYFKEIPEKHKIETGLFFINESILTKDMFEVMLLRHKQIMHKTYTCDDSNIKEKVQSNILPWLNDFKSLRLLTLADDDLDEFLQNDGSYLEELQRSLPNECLRPDEFQLADDADYKLYIKYAKMFAYNKLLHGKDAMKIFSKFELDEVIKRKYDPYLVCMIYYQFAMAYRKVHDYGMTLNKLQTSLSFANRMMNQEKRNIIRVFLFGYFEECYYKLKEYGKAKKFILLILKCEISSIEEKTNARSTLVLINADCGQAVLAQKRLEMQISDSFNDIKPNQKIMLICLLARCFIKNLNYVGAKESFSFAKELLHNHSGTLKSVVGQKILYFEMMIEKDSFQYRALDALHSARKIEDLEELYQSALKFKDKNDKLPREKEPDAESYLIQLAILTEKFDIAHKELSHPGFVVTNNKLFTDCSRSNYLTILLRALKGQIIKLGSEYCNHKRGMERDKNLLICESNIRICTETIILCLRYMAYKLLLDKKFKEAQEMVMYSLISIFLPLYFKKDFMELKLYHKEHVAEQTKWVKADMNFSKLIAYVSYIFQENLIAEASYSDDAEKLINTRLRSILPTEDSANTKEIIDKKEKEFELAAASFPDIVTPISELNELALALECGEYRYSYSTIKFDSETEISIEEADNLALALVSDQCPIGLTLIINGNMGMDAFNYLRDACKVATCKEKDLTVIINGTAITENISNDEEAHPLKAQDQQHRLRKCRGEDLTEASQSILTHMYKRSAIVTDAAAAKDVAPAASDERSPSLQIVKNGN